MTESIALLAVILAIAAAWQALRWRRAAGAARERAASHGRLLGMVSQDLTGAVLALSGAEPSDSEREEARRQQLSRQLASLADGIAEHLAAQAGPRRLKPEPVALRGLIEEAVAATAAGLGLGIRQWRIAAEFEAVVLQVDRRALLGALSPVLARAARSTRNGDWIDLRLATTAESVAIVVEDEGAGLAAVDLTPGAGITEAERTRGLGFGLATARSLMEAHGGALRLEAVRGIGARAWLSFPRERLVG